MPRQATRPYHNRLAVVFDLDDTLAPNTYASVIRSCGQDPEAFERDHVRRLKSAGWEEILARCYCLADVSERHGGAITAEYLAGVARSLDLFDGVEEMFDRIEQAAHHEPPEVTVELYLLSAGLAEIGRNLRIAHRFRRIWGCELHYGQHGGVTFVKQIVTHPEKVRYLLALEKGLETVDPDSSTARIYAPASGQELHVPLDQVIYVGDGASDLPAFRLMNERHGVAIGIVKQDTIEDWPTLSDMRSETRVQNLAAPDLWEGSELMESLTLAVRQVCQRIALRQLGQGE